MNISSDLKLIVLLDCSEEVMRSRLLKRGNTSGRSDDNLEVIQKRFKTHYEQCMPIINMYQKEGKLKIVEANRYEEDVYNDLEALIRKVETNM